MFGGKSKKKKAKQKRTQTKGHLDYTKIKLKKHDPDAKNPIVYQNNEVHPVYDMEQSSSILSIHDSIDFINKDNKSRESACDTNSDEDEFEDELYNNNIHNNEQNNINTPSLHTNYSASPAMSSQINDIEYEYEYEELDIRNETNNEINDLSININNINGINARESEIESPSKSYETESPSYEYKYEYNLFDVNTINIGAIKTPQIIKHNAIIDKVMDEEYICNTYNESFELENEDIESDIENEINFHDSRRRAIESDLLDLMISDSEHFDKETNDEIIEEHNYMGIIELLHMFGIHSLRYYFDSKLCIKYTNEIINYSPNTIKGGLICDNILTMISVYKMIQYLCKECLTGNLNGIKCTEWMEFNNNTFSKTFIKYKSEYLINYKQIDNSSRNSPKYANCNMIGLHGFEKKYIENIDVNKCMRQEFKVKISINKLPNKYRFEPSLFKFGIENEHNQNISNIYIDDRLTVKQNDLYQNIMYCENDRFIENGSAIYLKMKTVKYAKRKYLAINIMHETRDKKLYSKQYKFKLKKNNNNTKVFIQQFNGFGEYHVMYKYL